jgi:hypothetical protein
VALGGGVLCFAAAVAIHVPFVVDAQRRGFGSEFLGDYVAKWNLIKYEAQKRFLPKAVPKPEKKAAAFAAPAPEWQAVRFQKTPRNWVELERAKRVAAWEAQHKGRQKPELRDIFRQKSFYDAVWVAILYAPILVSGIIFVVAGAVLAWALCAGRADLREPSLVCLLTLGSALTLFSQYFFFRPDTPHLSEFMVPFVVAMACAVFYAVRIAASRAGVLRVACIAFVLLGVVAEALYFYHSMPKESAGTIAASRRRSHEMVAQNGVRVWLKRREASWVQAMHDAIVRHSAEGEWVVTFPYSPTINFMTNRPSYLKDLYIDNATARPSFTQDKIAEIEQFRPAVIVIDQRDINDTEISRFKNWAAPLYDYIRSRYVRVPGEFDTNEIYVRPDRMPPQA